MLLPLRGGGCLPSRPRLRRRLQGGWQPWWCEQQNVTCSNVQRVDSGTVNLGWPISIVVGQMGAPRTSNTVPASGSKAATTCHLVPDWTCCVSLEAWA